LNSLPLGVVYPFHQSASLGLNLLRISGTTFQDCSALSSLQIPSGLQEFLGSALRGTAVRDISVADGNPYFKVDGYFLADFEGVWVKQYFGDEGEVRIGKNVQRLEPGCLSGCRTISSLIFGPGCTLSGIELGRC
jgi:hypothetical protein